MKRLIDYIELSDADLQPGARLYPAWQSYDPYGWNTYEIVTRDGDAFKLRGPHGLMIGATAAGIRRMQPVRIPR